MKITFLLPVPSHVRYHKRVSALKHLGVEPTILAFERDYYAGKPWPDGYTSLGQLQHGGYHRRLVPLLKAFSGVRATARDSDVVYAFGLDMLFLVWLVSQTLRESPKIVYEVGDVHPMLIRSDVFSHLLRWMEHHILQCVNVVVVTSEAYITGYFQGVQKIDNLSYKVIENKVDIDDLLPRHHTESVLSREESDKLRLGYFGLIRCERSWRVLRELVRQAQGEVQVCMRGLPSLTETENQEIRNTEFVEYGGPYVYPDDLPSMYEQVHLVWIATYLSQGHLHWSRVNRFYEACYFKRPMIAQVNTQDGAVVDKLGLGMCIDLLDVAGAVSQILSIDEADLEIWERNLSELPKSIYAYTDEHEELLEMLS